MKRNSSRYINSITSKQFWKLTFLFGAVYFANIIFVDLLDEYAVESFLARFPRSKISDIFCIVFLVYALQRVVTVLRKKLVPTIASLYCASLILLYYYLVIINENKYSLYTLHFDFLSWMRYTDILVFGIAFIGLDFRAYQTLLEKDNILSLIPDESDPTKIKDLIYFEKYVQKIATAINNSACNVSYSIGVFSSWGSGKTDFLLRLRNELKSNKKENIILEFNPWKAATADSILEDFFAVLNSGLKSYSKSITSKLKSYSKKILSTGKEVQYRIADTVLDEMIKDPSLKERYDDINETIQNTGKRIIVFIDDLDRMTGTEVVQVLRLVRNCANFSNTFFVVALDHEYITSTLKKTNQFSKESEYLNKIFQLTITLPQIRKDTLGAAILHHLAYDQMPVEDKTKLEYAVSILQLNPLLSAVFGPLSSREGGPIEIMLDNYRDVKRFCNAFKLNFNILKDEVEIVDLFLLELIKAKSFYAYQCIANKILLQHSKNDPYHYELNENSWKSFETASGLDEHSLRDLKSTILKLFDLSRKKGSRMFALPYNFYLYFSFQLFDLIPLKEFQDSLKLSWNKIREKFDIWESEGKLADLERILDNYTDYQDKDQFEKFQKAFMLNSGKYDFTGRAKRALMNIDQNVKLFYENNKAEYINFVREILLDEDLPEYNRAIIGNELLNNSLFANEDLLLPVQELKEIIYELFDKYLNGKFVYDEQVYAFYLLNRENTDFDNFVRLNPKAHDRLEQYLSNPENFEEYLKYLIRSKHVPTLGEFVFAPFTIDIFKDWNSFLIKVKNHKTQSDEIKKLLKIIEAYTQNYIDGKQSFIPTESEKDYLLEHLRSTKQYPF